MLRRLYQWTEKSPLVDLIIIALALISVGLLVYELSSNLSPEQVAVIHTIDLVIALVFLLDFTLGIVFAEDKGRYLRQHWPDLLASLPVTEGIYRSFRLLRILRLVRIVRVIAGYNRVRDVADRSATDGSNYFYLVAITVTVILSGAVAMFTLELGENPGIRSFFDALWWAAAATSTSGSEIHPVTWEGRLVATVLMFFGVGLTGAIAGLMGSHFLKRISRQSESS